MFTSSIVSTESWYVLSRYICHLDPNSQILLKLSLNTPSWYFCHRRCCQLELLISTERWFSPMRPGRLISVYLAPCSAHQHLGPGRRSHQPGPGKHSVVTRLCEIRPERLLWDCKLYICHHCGPGQGLIGSNRGQAEWAHSGNRQGISFLAPTCENYVWVTQLVTAIKNYTNYFSY